jgi:hypothetical protein
LLSKKAAITIPAARVIWRCEAFTGRIIQALANALHLLTAGSQTLPRIARAADADRGSLKEEKKSYALPTLRIAHPIPAHLFRI